ncbi:MAG: tRNA glutamyl-Q(34) synthetase GluQRS [Gammaproteobacteria bacterium]|nr:tRNA glutamyl-Q(34) synthetase GluQRS [Gammaproteobacteria bacterium]MBU2059650.1 tRNA glutamyl-Q(34) synthetase GluQRS [Gammaproteobacteria bacterium]MBU2176085.1 tRNA glutamyl-Q(34) synthetase GluQRS [Gammaproteobacteria bacterium]MBU2245273.1 tRNA glutamyl-Q(34) synthetase GluQRS [Gammaproteobacteria bacterium]MBU2343859.1 tRNA glutamyl-Q(34) synthetase GluQRS [Gammaproteobacteria bacterium]
MMPVVPPAYRGRFAPSPSGPLHFGSLIAAVGSYLQAKSQQGQWLVRMEDIDKPRMQAGAADSILRTLERYQLLWDGGVWVQSQRLDRYQQVLDLLKQQQLTYACNCTRSRIQSLGQGYDGFCRDKNLTEGQLAWRLKAPATATSFTDQHAGEIQIPATLAAEDYILKRRDGLFAYQLVVVVDDMDQGITEVVRGADLIDLTSRQQALFRLLGAAAPDYLHLPLAVLEPGFKLSKQNHAPAVENWPVSETLTAVLRFLGQSPPAELIGADAKELLAWACSAWQIRQIPRQNEQKATDFL